MTKLRCISDSYTQTPDIFDSVDEFIAMCLECFGEAPAIVEQHDGWHDDVGLVLEPSPD